MQRDRQPADEDDILALAADRLGERLEVRLAEGLVLDQLDVPVGVLLAGRLVHHHLDAGVLRALQHRLERLAVVRDDADHVDLLGDEVLDRAHLLRRIVGGRVDHGRVDAEILAGLQHALLDVVEPRDLHLADDADLRRVVGRQRLDRRRARCGAQRRGALHQSAA